MPNIGITGFILIILVALLLFGPSKLPELGRAFGRTLREFKSGTKELLSDSEQDRKESATVTESALQLDSNAIQASASERKVRD